MSTYRHCGLVVKSPLTTVFWGVNLKRIPMLYTIITHSGPVVRILTRDRGLSKQGDQCKTEGTPENHGKFSGHTGTDTLALLCCFRTVRTRQLVALVISLVVLVPSQF
jgi:hypothetical protein